jgi:hypothetical protein
LAPSGFFLSGYVKGKLMGYRAENPSDLLVRIRVILAQIPNRRLQIGGVLLPNLPARAKIRMRRVGRR